MACAECRCQKCSKPFAGPDPTHAAGFCYDCWRAELARAVRDQPHPFPELLPEDYADIEGSEP